MIPRGCPILDGALSLGGIYYYGQACDLQSVSDNRPEGRLRTMVDQNPDTSDARQNDVRSRSRGSSVGQSGRLSRLLLYAAVLAGVFLLGLIPMWMKAHERAQERDRAQATLRISALQNTLANAASDARRGEYEGARQAASDFFTNLRTEIDRGGDSAFTPTQQNDLHSMFVERDETITLLARSDPASAERLFDLYNTYREKAAAEEKQKAALITGR